MDKINFGALLLTFGVSALFAFALFNINVTSLSKMHSKHQEIESRLQMQIDSLEDVVNTTFKNRKDTIVVNVRPQDVKIYNYDRTTRH